MANGSDRDEYTEISRVRSGLKREFTFALKSKAQDASSLGRTRSRSRHGMNREDEGWELEMEGSKKTTLEKIPTKLKELLETGLLEGISVRYHKGAKTKGETSNALKGRISGTGIVCSCSDCYGIEVVSPNEFEIHAKSKNKRAADYIYLKNGINLRDVLNACKNAPLGALESTIQSMIGCTSSSREQDVFCWNCKRSLTGGGGEEMLLCSCVTNRCSRIVGDLEVDIGRCALCRGHDFSTSGFGLRTIIICDQCEKEYHVSCLKEHDMDDLKELPEGKWFCCKECSLIHSALEERVAIGDDFLPEHLLNVVKTNLGDDDLCISWRLLSGSAPRANEDSEMLTKAVSIFQDWFDPEADSNSGLGDLIPHMVFGREVRGQDYGGMYCAVLKINSNVVSAGIIRVFGEEMVELPLIATSTEIQQGENHFLQCIFQVMYSCLENLLVSLNVKKLVLPAADGTVSFWTKKYGFSKIPQEELINYQKDYQIMVFQRTTMLQKMIVRS